MKTQILNKLHRQLIPNVGTIVVVALLLFAYTAWAAPSAQQTTPGIVSYQGALTNSAGEPITGSVDMTFRLYNAPTGGAALWEEAHTSANAVPVQNGLFHVYLGSLTPISATVWTNSPLYVGVQVGGDAEMSPREELAAVPYAMRAMQADTAMTVPDKAITSRKVQLLTGEARSTGDLTLTEAYQDVPGVVTTIDVPITSTVLLMSTCDFYIPSGAIAICRLSVDGQDDPAETILGWNDTSFRATVSNSYRFNLSPGTHTIKVKANSTGGGTMWSTHTGFTYFVTAAQ